MFNHSLPNNDFEILSKKEYLLTNGIGGFASGTLSGANTRRYHGLLTAALQPPVNRKVLVSKVEECIFTGRDTCISLSANQYPDVIQPQGYQYLQHFERMPIPTWDYQVDSSSLRKSIFMVQDSNTTVVKYENTGSRSFKLSLLPLFVFRDYHSLFHQDKQFDYYFKQSGNALTIYAQYGTMPLFFSFSKGTFKEERNWFYNFQYQKEKERGLDYQEDAYAIGKVAAVLNPGENIYLTFSTDEKMLQTDLLKLEKKASKKKTPRPNNNLLSNFCKT